MRARARGENFPVALRILPRALRRDLLALYGFARLVDEVGDAAPGDRLASLDAIEADLARAFAGRAHHPLLADLTPTLWLRALPRQPFLDLIEANRVDQRVRRYASFEELRGYCSLSANPIGRLVLQVLGAATPRNMERSDALCTALQLVEHLQDVVEDLDAGRVYLPQCDLERFGCCVEDLSTRPAPARVRRLMAFEGIRARSMLRRGEPLLGDLRGAGRLAVTGFVAGGWAALDALARAGWDVTPGPPVARRRDVARRALGAWRRGRRR